MAKFKMETGDPTRVTFVADDGKTYEAFFSIHLFELTQTGTNDKGMPIVNINCDWRLSDPRPVK